MSYFPSDASGEESACQCSRCKRRGFSRSLGWQDPLEKEMANHSSILAWRLPWTEEPGRPRSTGSRKVRRLSDQTKTTTQPQVGILLPQFLGAGFLPPSLLLIHHFWGRFLFLAHHSLYPYPASFFYTALMTA